MTKTYRGRAGDFTLYAARQTDQDYGLKWDDSEHWFSVPAGKGMCIWLRESDKPMTEATVECPYPTSIRALTRLLLTNERFGAYGDVRPLISDAIAVLGLEEGD